MPTQVMRIEIGRPIAGGAVLALDALDGVDLSQGRLVEQAVREARALGAPAAAILFEPGAQPLPDGESASVLATRDQEVRALRRLGVDQVYSVVCDPALVRMGPEDFARELLGRTLQVRHVVATPELAYGRAEWIGRQTLVEVGRDWGFGVSFAEAETALQVGARDQLRRLVVEGRMGEVTALLGRPFSIEGRVQHGAKLGRTIGFPTANVSLGDYVRPAAGTYASVSRLADGRVLTGLAYIGRRPTVDNGEVCLEVFLCDLNEEIYGQPLETALIERLRPDERFESLDSMRQQMLLDLRDSAHARAALPTMMFAD